MAVPVATVLPLLLLLTLAAAEPRQGERSALQAFLAGTPHERTIGWNASVSACAWTGVTCDRANATVVELRLPGIGLIGRVPPGTLGRLLSLQVISLRSNRLVGDIPRDLFSLPRLRSLYLQGNLLTGAVPAEVGRLSSLEHLALSHNNLSGPVPFALNSLTQLRSLRLEDNRLSGSLPSISIRRLEVFNVSYNELNGSIPSSLARFPPDSFAGNLQLCGEPLDRPCQPFFPSPAPSPVPVVSKKKKKKKLSGTAVAAIAVGAGAASLLALVLLVLCAVLHHRRRRSEQEDGSKAAATPSTRDRTPSTEMGSGEGFTSSSKEISGAATAAAADRSRLVFVGKRGGGAASAWQQSFDLEDLLRASAEVLGKGGLGTSYKATLEEGTTVAVKRLRDVAAARREFAACVEAAAAVEHRNLAPLRAYYYSKDEKLLIADYLPAGSLSARLHGGRDTGRTPMDWEARMRAALCAARGVAHLHTAPRLAHGNIKSSNLLLRLDPDAAALSDYGLNQLFAPAPAARPNVAGYRAPELVDARRPTFKSDVYSLGVLFLELLTGKSPAHRASSSSLDGDGAVDLPRWVQSVVREEWTAEVFDAELVRLGGGAEEEMVALLQVAMACVATAADARPDANDVVRMVEEIGGGHGRTTTEESEGTRGVSEEERSRGATP